MNTNERKAKRIRPRLFISSSPAEMCPKDKVEVSYNVFIQGHINNRFAPPLRPKAVRMA